MKKHQVDKFDVVFMDAECSNLLIKSRFIDLRSMGENCIPADQLASSQRLGERDLRTLVLNEQRKC